MSVTTIEPEKTVESSTATGPKTEAGKSRSRRNSLKHGLSGNGVILPSELSERIEHRKAACRLDYKPQGIVQEFLVDRIGTETVLLEHCEALKIVAMDWVALDAVETWDTDRKLDAAILFDKLKRKPEIVQKRLLQTTQGCDTLVQGWESIACSLRRIGLATLEDPAYLNRIFDLMGLSEEQRTWDMVANLGTDNPLQFVEAQIADLKRRQLDSLDDRDARDQADAQVGLNINSPKLRTILRYEAAIQRRLQWTINELRTLQNLTDDPAEPSTPTPPAPQPESKPAPPPPPPMTQAPPHATPPVNLSERGLASYFTEAPAKPQPIVNNYKPISRKERRRRQRELGQV